MTGAWTPSGLAKAMLLGVCIVVALESVEFSRVRRDISSLHPPYILRVFFQLSITCLAGLVSPYGEDMSQWCSCVVVVVVVVVARTRERKEEGVLGMSKVCDGHLSFVYLTFPLCSFYPFPLSRMLS